MTDGKPLSGGKHTNKKERERKGKRKIERNKKKEKETKTQKISFIYRKIYTQRPLEV